MCVRDTGKGGRERERAKQEETENSVIPFSILVTKVTPGLYINMTEEPLCLSSLPLWEPRLFLPMVLMFWVRGKHRDSAKGKPCHPIAPMPALLALPNIYLPTFP